jgi:hypothetical protein
MTKVNINENASSAGEATRFDQAVEGDRCYVLRLVALHGASFVIGLCYCAGRALRANWRETVRPSWKLSPFFSTTHASISMTTTWIQGGRAPRAPLNPRRRHANFCVGGGRVADLFHEGRLSTRQ